MADASHQLRTPISVALAAAQVTNRDPNATAADCKDSLQIVENQMLQLRRAVEDMFFLSQADSASLKIDSKEVYLDDAIAEAVRAAKPLAAAKRQTVKINGLPEAKCTGDSNLLTKPCWCSWTIRSSLRPLKAASKYRCSDAVPIGSVQSAIQASGSPQQPNRAFSNASFAKPSLIQSLLREQVWDWPLPHRSSRVIQARCS